MPALYRVESDHEPVFVLAQDFQQAIRLWRACYNERWEGEPDVDPLTEEDQPDQVTLVADEDEVYLPGGVQRWPPPPPGCTPPSPNTRRSLDDLLEDIFKPRPRSASEQAIDAAFDKIAEGMADAVLALLKQAKEAT